MIEEPMMANLEWRDGLSTRSDLLECFGNDALTEFHRVFRAVRGLRPVLQIRATRAGIEKWALQRLPKRPDPAIAGVGALDLNERQP